MQSDQVPYEYRVTFDGEIAASDDADAAEKIEEETDSRFSDVSGVLIDVWEQLEFRRKETLNGGEGTLVAEWRYLHEFDEPVRVGLPGTAKESDDEQAEAVAIVAVIHRLGQTTEAAAASAFSELLEARKLIDDSATTAGVVLWGQDVIVDSLRPDAPTALDAAAAHVLYQEISGPS